jgi:N-acetylmuramoyl-L-alanine amidase
VYRVMGKAVVRSLLLIGAVLLTGAALYGRQTILTQAPAEQSRVIVLDAGHGGADPGAVGVNGVLEKDINLDIALCLRDMLEASGWEVILVREDDISVNDPQYTKISQVKTSDLKNRLKLFEAHPEGVALSIHQNHFTQERYHGAQMFYGRENSQSLPLAESIQSSFRELLQPENTRQVKPSTKDVYIVYHSTIPTVLVECGFLSNQAECDLLCDPEYRQKVAFAIYCGLLRYAPTQDSEDL